MESRALASPGRVVVASPSFVSLTERARERHSQVNVEPSEKANASSHGFATSYEEAPVRYAMERQRQKSRGVVRDAQREAAVKTTFEVYVTDVSLNDVVRASVFRGSGAKEGETNDVKMRYALGTCEILARRVPTIEAGEPARWIELNHELRVPEKLGRLKFQCYFDHEIDGMLRVKVVSAHGIKGSDLSGLSDPYVVVKLHRVNESTAKIKALAVASGDAFGHHAGKDSFRTETVKKTLDPVWNETFEFERVDRGSESYVTFELWDHDMVGDDDLLSQYAVRVREIKAARPMDTHAAIRDVEWRQLTTKLECLGKMNVIAYFKDDARTDLRIIAARAMDLSAGDVFGTSNAYAEVMCGTQLHATAPRAGTKDPVWNHAMKFTVATERKSSAADVVAIRVYHLNRQGKSLFMGCAKISVHRLLTERDGGAKRSFWLALVEEKQPVCAIDLRMRVYVASEEPAERPVVEESDCAKEKVHARLYYDATYARARRLVRAREKAAVVAASDKEMAFHTSLAETIESRLRDFKWPEDLVPAYARAYAACCDDPMLLPPPPDGMKIPSDVIKMFEAAAFSRVESDRRRAP